MERIVKGIWVPIEIWEDQRLCWNEKVLLMEVDSFTSKGKECYISNEYISNLLNVKERVASKYVSHLISLGLLKMTKFDGRRRWVKSTLPSCEAESHDCARQNSTEMQPTYNKITNIDNNIISLSNKRTRVKFSKPTIEEIADYCRERNNGIDAVAFYNFYESKGWKVGSALMKDWRAAVVTWEQRRKNEPKAPTGRTPQPPYHKETTLEYNLKVYDQLAGTNLYEHYYGNHEQTNEDYDEQ